MLLGGQYPRFRVQGLKLGFKDNRYIKQGLGRRVYGFSSRLKAECLNPKLYG